MNLLKVWWKRLRCKHSWEFSRNVYGDEINYLDCRSIWKCAKCGDYQRRLELHRGQP